MPKIRNAHVTQENTTVEVVVYYFPPKRQYEEGKFFVTPVKLEFILPESELLQSRNIGKNFCKGAVGKTEQDALENFKNYLKEYNEKSLSKEALIFLRISQSKKEQSGWNKRDHSKNVITDASISFEYRIGYKMKIGKEIKYFEDGIYHNERKDNTIHNAEDNYTIIPFSEQAVWKCEAIINEFHVLSDKLDKLFSNQKEVLKLLLSDSKLIASG